MTESTIAVIGFSTINGNVHTCMRRILDHGYGIHRTDVLSIPGLDEILMRQSADPLRRLCVEKLRIYRDAHGAREFVIVSGIEYSYCETARRFIAQFQDAWETELQRPLQIVHCWAESLDADHVFYSPDCYTDPIEILVEPPSIHVLLKACGQEDLHEQYSGHLSDGLLCHHGAYIPGGAHPYARHPEAERLWGHVYGSVEMGSIGSVVVGTHSNCAMYARMGDGHDPLHHQKEDSRAVISRGREHNPHVQFSAFHYSATGPIDWTE